MSSTNNIYNSTSPYFNTSLSANGQYLGLWQYRPIPVAKSDQIITISSVYDSRPDLLAHDLYGDSRLWWVFAVRNPNTLAADPLGNFTQGLQIAVPNPKTLKTVLGIS